MGKAYDFTWKHGVLIDIYEAGIEGKMFKFIQTFHEIRSFKLEVDEIICNTEIQIKGIPQGSVIIPTFFIQKKLYLNCRMKTYFRYHFLLMVSRYPTGYQMGRLLRESSMTV